MGANSSSCGGRPQPAPEAEDVLVLGAARLARLARLARPADAGDGGAVQGLAVTARSLCEAAERVGPLAHRTPVAQCETLRALAFPRARRGRLLMKCENQQRAGAFKFRGAVNAVAALLAGPERPRAFVTESSGNHGQALALAARLFGVPATVVMPDDAPAAKVEAVRGYGATAVLVPPAERASACARVVRECGAVLVHPSNEPLVMSGQGTLMLEFFEQAARAGAPLDCVIVPVGGGGLLSGVAVAAKLLNPNMLVVAGEPAAADDAFRSLRSGRLEGHPGGKVPDTIAGGLKTTLGSNTWPVAQRLVDRVVCVSEREIAAAMRLLFERAKQVVEPSAAVPLAALLSQEMQQLLSERADIVNVGIVLSGGNFSSTEPMPWTRDLPHDLPHDDSLLDRR